MWSSSSSSADTDIVVDESGTGSAVVEAEVTSSPPDEDSTQAVKLYEEISEMEPGPLLHKVGFCKGAFTLSENEGDSYTFWSALSKCAVQIKWR